MDLWRKNSGPQFHHLQNRSVGLDNRCMHAKLCPAVCDPMDCSPPSSSFHGILQARVLQWVAIPSSRRSSDPRTEPRSPALQADSLPSEPARPPSAGLAPHCRADSCLQGSVRVTCSQGRKVMSHSLWESQSCPPSQASGPGPGPSRSPLPETFFPFLPSGSCLC